MKKNIGIAIIDVYGQLNLDRCYESIPKEFENLIVVSDTKNELPPSKTKRYGQGVPFATLKNWAINYFRIKGLKHYFLINSNIVIKDPTVFEKTINIANTFGTWAFLGPAKKSLSIEDDKANLSLNFSDEINSDFIYLFDGVVSNVGFFDERYFNTKTLDTLDYVIRMRNKNIYPPVGYNPIINDGLEITKGNIEKKNYREMSNADHSVNMSYGYFLTQHKYIPTQNDPNPVSNDELMETLETLQKNYANKL